MKHAYKMYCFLLLGFLLLKIPQDAYATHILGGEIVAEVVSCNGNTYHIKVIIYEDAGSEVEFGNGVIDFGHGDAINLDTYDDFNRSAPDKGSIYRVVTYEAQHTFPGPGEYLINFREFNRHAGIRNMHNAVQTPFYIETKLLVDPLLGCNSTPVLSDSFNVRAYAHARFVQPLHVADPDGDSLSFAFVTPKQDADTEVSRYFSPVDFDLRYVDNPTASDGMSEPTLTANKDQLVWDAPNVGGEFTYALQVSEWRKVDNDWINLGYMIRDMTIYVEDTVNHTNITTGTHEEVVKPTLNLYPNPSEGPVTLEINSDLWMGGTVSVYNIIGQLVTKKAIDDNEIAFDLTHQSNGIYLFTLQNDLAQKTLRIVKK